MFSLGKGDGLLQDMAFGAVAGIVGTAALSGAFQLFQKLSGEDQPGPEGEDQEPGVQILAERMHHAVGAEPTESRKEKLGQVIHWGYGMSWGAIYGVLRNRVPALSWGMGIPFGVAFGVLSDIVVLTLAGLAPPPKELPAMQHAQAVAGHVVYAVAADGAYRGMQRVFASEQSRLERMWGQTRERLSLR